MASGGIGRGKRDDRRTGNSNRSFDGQQSASQHSHGRERERGRRRNSPFDSDRTALQDGGDASHHPRVRGGRPGTDTADDCQEHSRGRRGSAFGRARERRRQCRPSSTDEFQSGTSEHASRGRYRPRRGRSTPAHDHSATARSRYPFTTETICHLSTLDAEELVKRIDSQLKEFQQALGNPKTVGKPDQMNAVLNILSKLTNLASKRGADFTDDQRAASRIVAEILSERSDKFHFHLSRAVKNCSSSIQAELFCDVFLEMLNSFETSAWNSLPIDELRETVNQLPDNSPLLEKAKHLCETRDQMRKAHTSHKPTNKAESTPSDNERDDSEFRLLPLLPEWKEINNDTGIPPEVRPNRLHTPYKNWLQYYDIHFRLIREDFIAPLRRGVTAFLKGERGRKNRDVKTYSDAVIHSQVTTRDKGICFMVKFDVSGFRRVNYKWNHSKRLIFGSLLCFIPITKDDILFGTVADRKEEDLNNGEFMVQFEGSIIDAMTHCRQKTKFELVESNSYFEATSPILRSIQKAEVETMPFTKQLIEGQCDVVAPPAYLQVDAKPVYNLSCLYGSMKKRRLKPPLTIEVLNTESWEAVSNVELDSSQLNAIQTALTQEIAVIQGPPGTGKTYIGLKIVEGLLENRKVWDPCKSSPIFVMCYTNHALDQFLEGIIDTECHGREIQVIRVGGRCKSEKVDAYNLNKVCRSAPWWHRRDHEISQNIAELKEEMENCNPEKIWNKINGYHFRRSLLPMTVIWHLAHPDHFYQLTQMVYCKEHKGKELEVWLGLWEEVVYQSKKEKMKKNAKSGEREQQNDVKKQPQQPHKPFVPNTHENEKMKEEKIEREATLAQDERMLDNEHQRPQSTDKDVEHRDAQPNDMETQPQQPDKGSVPNTHENESEDKMEEEEKIEIEGEATLAQDERMLDNDVEGYQRVQSIEKDVEHRDVVEKFHKGQLSDSSDDDSEGEEEDIHKKSKWVRRLDADYTIMRNLFKNPMDDEEADEIEQIDRLSPSDRWRLYNHWAEKRYKYLQECNREQVRQYSEKCRELANLKQLEDRYILEKADVVGMTTTGAAKYQHILHQIKPKIVIVEEAAEVLEAHIVSALSAGTQHLILIGDHKQLRPKPNEYVLATKYNLAVSLFERLVKNKMSRATLEIQHRMRPEIACLVCPHVYDKLLNHESVMKYPQMQGISKNLFFIHHTEPESENPGLLSYENEFEAKYIASLCAHLLKLGYAATQITILTPYVGQLLKLRDKMPKKVFEGVHVTAIDNFQGEENDIILFSMVRSTNTFGKEPTIGFLKEDNRVCVSLSRAKHGFYAIGNFNELIRHQSGLWESIISDVESKGCFGDALPLYCCNHPEMKYTAKKESDFRANAPCGGCQKDCDIRLPCGHSCTQKCHIVDREHKNFRCMKVCERACPIGHPCKSKHVCWKKCRPCQEIVMKIMPICGHEQHIPCSVDPDKCECFVKVEKEIPICKHKQMVPCYLSPFSFKCQASCTKLCPQNLHILKKLCREVWSPCMENVEITLPKCGHCISTPCFKDTSRILCENPCDKLCGMGHKCPKLCHEDCGPCLSEVSKDLDCGHTHLMHCWQATTNDFKCPTRCSKPRCKEGHDCIKRCHYPLPCGPCDKTVKIRMPLCSHEQSLPCFMSVDPQLYGYMCSNPCEKELECRHRCQKKCGESCQTICTKKVTVKLLCGHTIGTECWRAKDKSMLMKECSGRCNKKLECGHVCQEICSKECTEKCTKLIKRKWPCGHELERECFKTKCMDQYPCDKKCRIKLPCGHPCKNTCGEPCSTCSLKSSRKYPCGHSAKIPCKSTIDAYPCKRKCNFVLSCGHCCSGICSKCSSSRLHASCTFDIKLSRYCGHSEVVPCAGLSDLCSKAHLLPCIHGQEDHTKCQEMCKWDCPHFECENECREVCERPPCNKPCAKFLPCGHKCFGVCGEPCLTVCPECDPGKFKEKTHPKQKKKGKVLDQPYIELGCGHIIPVVYLDEYMDPKIKTVMPKQCPKCHQIIPVGFRYGNAVRRAMRDVENVREIMRQHASISGIEREQMITSIREMNTTTNMPKYFRTFHQLLITGSPITREKSCLFYCLCSFYNLYSSLQHQVKDFPDVDGIMDSIKSLVKLFARGGILSHKPDFYGESMVPERKSATMYLSQQLLDDFKSELYRLALCAQCIIARGQYPHIEKGTGPDSIITTVDTYIRSLDPLKDRISEIDYEWYSRQMEKAFPVVDTIHVQTPPVPSVIKGTWMKCPAGHYYCRPPVFGSRTKSIGQCPDCD